MKSYLPVLFVFASSISSFVHAEPYVGFGVGSASYDVDLRALGAGEFDDNVTATKLYGGYGFNQYFALEAAVYNFAEASVAAIEVTPGNFASASASVDGVGAYLVGSYPVSKEVTISAKLGMLDWDADLRVNNTTASNDGTDQAYAIAASYAFTKEFLIAAEWEQYDSDNPELSMFSVGFRFNFI